MVTYIGGPLSSQCQSSDQVSGRHFGAPACSAVLAPSPRPLGAHARKHMTRTTHSETFDHNLSLGDQFN